MTILTMTTSKKNKKIVLVIGGCFLKSHKGTFVGSRDYRSRSLVLTNSINDAQDLRTLAGGLGVRLKMIKALRDTLRGDVAKATTRKGFTKIKMLSTIGIDDVK